MAYMASLKDDGLVLMDDVVHFLTCKTVGIFQWVTGAQSVNYSLYRD